MADLYLLVSTFKDLARPRKLAAAGLLAVLPAAIALIMRLKGAAHGFKPDVAYDTLEANLVFGFVLVILAVVFGTGVIAQEVEQKTISYLLTRPEPRWRLVLVKFAAAITAITVTVWLASFLLALTTSGPSGLFHSRLGRDCLILPVGALAYGAIFLLLATILNRPLLIGLIFAFGWESWVPQLPGNFAKVSLISYLRALAPHTIPKADSMDLSEVLMGAVKTPVITHSLARWVLTVVIAGALGLALIIFSTREYVPRDDAD